MAHLADLARRHLGLLAGVLLLTSVTLATTPLEDYVNSPEDVYGYEVLNSFRLDEATVYVLKMTSVTWFTVETVSQPVWWHYLQVVVPDKLTDHDTAFLWIDEGDNTDRMPDKFDQYLRLVSTIAVDTGTIVADLKQVPNQPLHVYNDPAGSTRREDSLVAWSWDHYIQNGQDPHDLIQLPMTKAAVLAMDTVQEFVQEKINHKINDFVVSGASKGSLYLTSMRDGVSQRGWIAWLIAAVDQRVKGIIPVVLTCLNFVENLHHHYRAMNGGWSFAIGPYYDQNITQLLDDPRVAQAFQIIDPYAYLDRLKLPKYIIAAGNDEFFFPDDTHYFYDKLIGPSYFRIVPNAEHILVGSIRNIIDGARAFYIALLNGQKMPTLKWHRETSSSEGRIVLTTDMTPSQVRVWSVTSGSKTRRDFRALKLGSPWNPDMIWPQNNIWKSDTLETKGDGVYIAQFESPRLGWFAFFIEVFYDAGDGEEFRFTSEVSILPDTFPAEDCHGAECYATLV